MPGRNGSDVEDGRPQGIFRLLARQGRVEFGLEWVAAERWFVAISYCRRALRSSSKRRAEGRLRRALAVRGVASG
jgi:hypothetical protein